MIGPRAVGLLLGCSILGGVALFGAAPSSAAGVQSQHARPFYSDGERAYVKPHRFCPANHTCFAHVQWSSWGRSAVGHGRATYGSTDGTETSYRTRIVLSRLRHMCGDRVYTHVKWGRGETSFNSFGGTCGSWSGG